MKLKHSPLVIVFALVMPATLLLPSWADGRARTAPLVIDHTCVDIAKIPMSWIDAAQAEVPWHYAHTSHGSQLVLGLDTIEAANPAYDVEIGRSLLPEAPGALCIFQGQEDDTYITPELYWATAEGMEATRTVLRNNPEIVISGFAWCTQLSSADSAYVAAYLDSMTALEAEFPNVIFMYMTGNAQSYGAAPNRTMRNRQIRDYCLLNNKVLYDFEDLDCWWFNPDTQEWEYSTTTDYWGNVWPVQHPHFDGTEAGHTTWESCIQKGRAVWWMMAVLAGWDGSTTGVDSSESWGNLKGMYR